MGRVNYFCALAAPAVASRFGIRWELDCPDEAFLALELIPGSLAGKSGVVRFRPEFARV